MNTPVHSAPARASQSHMTRRAALASVGALALAASGTAALASEPHTSPVAGLIEAYHRSYAAYVDAEEARCKLTLSLQASLAQHPVIVRLGDTADSNVALDDGLTIFEHVIQSRTKARIDAILRANVEVTRDVARAIALEFEHDAASFAALRRGQEEVESRAQTMGLRDAEELEDRLEVAMRQAWDAILSYRPQTLHEVREVFDFYRSDDGFGKYARPGERETTLMFAALSSPSPEA